ncbi:hypothetical protein BKA24_001781 [Microbacterium marinum]|uniref:Uncharacterized protein n=1 Tax=Microbacterium marinum TaxID=421115 RepID=A0A7W7FIG8_9MICO|nr:hypothetical protein [Microbacterium marinum]MBB4667072.1 hypothetical protein [Microbacterium marinum]
MSADNPILAEFDRYIGGGDASTYWWAADFWLAHLEGGGPEGTSVSEALAAMQPLAQEVVDEARAELERFLAEGRENKKP